MTAKFKPFDQFACFLHRRVLKDNCLIIKKNLFASKMRRNCWKEVRRQLTIYSSLDNKRIGAKNI